MVEPLLRLAALGLAAVVQPGPQAPPPVVFVCEHGNVKSLIAASLFNRLAEARGLPFRAVARGVHPEDRVPDPIAAALRGEGFEVGAFRPLPFSPQELPGALRTVAIGIDLPAPAESWSDVPPASLDYAAAHAALQRHVEALLAELQRGAAKR